MGKGYVDIVPDMGHVTLQDLCTEPTVTWRLQRYAPLATEYVDDAAWRHAKATAVGEAYRLNKLVRGPGSRLGHYVVARSFRLLGDPIGTTESGCPICKKRVRREGVLVAGFAFHKRCLPAWVDHQIAHELTLFGDEMTDVRHTTSNLPIK